jgi:para-nitrobenzyl esterase
MTNDDKRARLSSFATPGTAAANSEGRILGKIGAHPVNSLDVYRRTPLRPWQPNPIEAFARHIHLPRHSAAYRLRALIASAACAAALLGCGGGEIDESSSPATAKAQTMELPATRVPTVTAVQTRFGWVRGNSYSGGQEFLGIPFARPPVGALRWRPPVDPVPWTSVLATQAFGPACPQKRFSSGDDSGTIDGDEDCLQLNVWTPAARTTPLPVLVFIHGGGQQQGGAGAIQAGTQIYNGRNMAARGHAVVVTVQYRLGPLGFLVHPGLERENASGTSGNYGVMDQIQALKWVQNNIAAFGGDPTRVMVFGQSAGGVNMGNLLTSPVAKGLFQRAGIESAGPVISPYAKARTSGTDYVDGLVASGTDAQKIAALRARDWYELIDSETPPVEGGVVQMNWQPVIDGVVFKTDPATAFASGQFNRVPVLIGSTADEMSLSAPAVVQPARVDLLIAAMVPAPYRDQARQLYPPGSTPEEAKHSYVQILTDAQFTSLTRRTARAVAAQQPDPVWRYLFSHRHAGVLQSRGAYHGIDLFYVFNTWESTPYAQGGAFTPEDAAVQTQMLKRWVNFARTGNPNGRGLVTWPRFDGATDCYLEITATPNGSQCGLRTERSDLWDLVFAQPD